MKNVLKTITLLTVLLVTLAACSFLEGIIPREAGTQDPALGLDAAPDDTGIVSGENASPNDDGAVSFDKIQRWAADEFQQTEEDWMFFAPTTDDYMLTEAYLQEQEDSGIIYTMTILRSFDGSGAVVSQVMKYTFDIPPDAEYCYWAHFNDDTDYPLLVCVGFSVYIEQPDDVVLSQRLREQFISDYQAEGVKHWLSKP